MTASALTASNVAAAENPVSAKAPLPPEESGELYLPSDDAMADVDAILDLARKNNKLALVVLGGNWCHDSRGLAARLHQEPLRSLVNDHYETLFVDVGFLDKGKDVIKRLGPSVYYATPTVLIIDPISGLLVNESNRHQWAEAYNISMQQSVEYFQLMASTDLTRLRSEQQIPENLQLLLTEIDTFENIQAERLYAAYAVIGPMLEDYNAGNKGEKFEDYWMQIRKFRYQVPVDVDALTAEAKKRVVAGEQHIKLDYPEYPPFSWETPAP